jgi:hypothetical protein
MKNKGYSGANKSYYTYKYVFLYLALSFFLLLTISLIDPNIISGNVNFEGTSPKIVLLILGLISLFLFWKMYHKVVLVRFLKGRLVIKKNGVEKEYDWNEIDSIKAIIGTTPPLYVIRFTNNSWCLFSTGHKFISINGLTIDLSDFKKQLQK